MYDTDTSSVSLHSWVGTSKLLRVYYDEGGRHKRVFKGYLEASGTENYLDLYLYDGSKKKSSGQLVPLKTEYVRQINVIEDDGHSAADWVALGVILGGGILVSILFITGTFNSAD